MSIFLTYKVVEKIGKVKRNLLPAWGMHNREVPQPPFANLVETITAADLRQNTGHIRSEIPHFTQNAPAIRRPATPH